MAGTSTYLLRLLRYPDPLLRSRVGPILRHLSTSSDPSPGPETEPEPEPEPERGSSFFKDVKDSLRTESPPSMRPQMQRKTFSFSNSKPLQSPPSKTASWQEINKNLSEFRVRSAVPPPSSSVASDQSPSLHELYMKREGSQTGSSDSTTPSKYMSSATGGSSFFDAIREKLRPLKATTMSQRGQNDYGGKPSDPMSLASLKVSLKRKPGEMNSPSPQVIIGGTDGLPASLFGKHKDNGASSAGPLKFLSSYNGEEMGKKLASLRPEKKGKWFSLQELKDRLDKMRLLEDKEMESRNLLFGAKDLRDSLASISSKSVEQAKRDIHQRYSLSYLGGTPSFLLKPPKDHLVEKYFHPDHLSSAEKLKMKLQKVRDEFKMSESDCGSARVQVAQLTTKIKHLSTVLHKKDKHSRKGLEEMVQRRKKLLKYLRKTDWDSYTLVLSKLGLRDNPDLKA